MLGYDALLLTDQADRSVLVADALRGALGCTVLTLADDWGAAPLSAGIVADLDIGRRDVALRLKSLATKARSRAPVVCLKRSSARRSVAEAVELGATFCLPAETPPKAVAAALVAHIHPGETFTRVVSQRAVCRAEFTLMALMEAARTESTIDVVALENGVEPIVTALQESGLAHWLDVVWRYDDATHQHCLLVAGLAAAFALHLGFKTADRSKFVRASLVHDVGKARIPLSILNKPGQLDSQEMAIMRSHAAIGHDLLQKTSGFDHDTLAVVRSHHELLDGSGYPDGLAGDEIGDLVRIVTICDIYAALIEHRPYRKPMTSIDAFAVMNSMGEKLEPSLLAEFQIAIGTETDNALKQNFKSTSRDIEKTSA